MSIKIYHSKDVPNFRCVSEADYLAALEDWNNALREKAHIIMDLQMTVARQKTKLQALASPQPSTPSADGEVVKALECIKAEALEAWAGYQEPDDPRQMDDKTLNDFVLQNGSDGETYARLYWHAKSALARAREATNG